MKKCVFAILLWGVCLHMSIPCFGQPLKEISNVAYTSDPDDTLRQINLVLPSAQESHAPLLLWIGGGAWAYVDRHKEMDVCRRIAASGIAVASVGHRLSAQLLGEPKQTEGVTHPSHVQDIAQAFAWLHDHAAEYGYSPDLIFVGGFSSGAHLSALLASDDRYLNAVGMELEDIAGIIPVGGAFDIVHYRDILTAAVPEHMQNHIHPVFGATEAQQIDASPSTYLDHLKAPVLLISDSNTYKYNKHFEEQLKSIEFTSLDVLHVGSKTHGELWKDLTEEQSFYREVIVNFILEWSRA